MFDAGFGVIGDHHFRRSAEEFQSPDMRVDPARQLLVSGSFNERVAAGAEDGDKYRRLEVDHAGTLVRNRDLLAGESTNIFSPARCSCRSTTSSFRTQAP
jgi:hypothetical protein